MLINYLVLAFQDIGYAKLANLDPQYGLCKFTPPFNHSQILNFNILDGLTHPVFEIMGSQFNIGCSSLDIYNMCCKYLIQLKP